MPGGERFSSTGDYHHLAFSLLSACFMGIGIWFDGVVDNAVTSGRVQCLSHRWYWAPDLKLSHLAGYHETLASAIQFGKAGRARGVMIGCGLVWLQGANNYITDRVTRTEIEQLQLNTKRLTGS